MSLVYLEGDLEKLSYTLGRRGKEGKKAGNKGCHIMQVAPGGS